MLEKYFEEFGIVSSVSEVTSQMQTAALELISCIWVGVPLIKQASESLQIVVKKFPLQGKFSVVVDMIDICSILLHKVKSIIKTIISV
jgi:hypothetical protein